MPGCEGCALGWRFACKLIGAVAATLLMNSWTTAGFAQATDADRESARQLMDQGREAESEGRLQDALLDYQRAASVMRVPTTGLAVARVQAAMGLLLEAKTTALQVARLPGEADENQVLKAARQEAIALGNALEKRIPAVELVVEGASDTATSVRVDGIDVPAAALALPRRVNPGAHRIEASAPGYQAVVRSVEVSEGQLLRVVLALEPDVPVDAPPIPPKKPSPTPAPRPRDDVNQDGLHAQGAPWLTYVGLGVGSAGILAGTVTGVLSLDKTSDIKEDCDGNRCPASLQDRYDTANQLATVSTVSFAVGSGRHGDWRLRIAEPGVEP